MPNKPNSSLTSILTQNNPPINPFPRTPAQRPPSNALSNQSVSKKPPSSTPQPNNANSNNSSKTTTAWKVITKTLCSNSNTHPNPNTSWWNKCKKSDTISVPSSSWRIRGIVSMIVRRNSKKEKKKKKQKWLSNNNLSKSRTRSMRSRPPRRKKTWHMWKLMTRSNSYRN